MTKEETPESKETRLIEERKLLQNRIVRTYSVDFDPLYAKADAIEYAKLALEWNKYLVEWGPEDNLDTVKDQVQTWEEALQGLEEYKEDQELKDDPTEGWKYLKAALRDEGLSYLERDKPLVKALINLALSLPTGEFR